MVLIFLVKLYEICAPTPDTNDHIRIIFGVLLRIDKSVSVDGIELKLMSAEVNIFLDEGCNLLNALLGIEYGGVEFHGERSAVYRSVYGRLGEGGDDREGSLVLDVE